MTGTVKVPSAARERGDLRRVPGPRAAPPRAALVLVALLAAAGTARAQLASSPAYRLVADSLAVAGGGDSSQGAIAYGSTAALAHDELVSPGFTARGGLLAAHDPAIGELPRIWAIVPDHGDKGGGKTVRVAGANFGATPDVAIGGVPVDGLVVHSGALVTVVTPPSPHGPQDVKVSTVRGEAALAGGFVNAPAVVASPVAIQGAPWRVTSYGRVGDTFQMWVSPTTTSAGTQFGTLLIGPDILFQFLPSTPYLPPRGIFELELLLPVDPLLAGFTVHIQNLHVDATPPGELTNATSTTFF